MKKKILISFLFFFNLLFSTNLEKIRQETDSLIFLTNELFYQIKDLDIVPHFQKQKLLLHSQIIYDFLEKLKNIETNSDTDKLVISLQHKKLSYTFLDVAFYEYKKIFPLEKKKVFEKFVDQSLRKKRTDFSSLPHIYFRDIEFISKFQDSKLREYSIENRFYKSLLRENRFFAPIKSKAVIFFGRIRFTTRKYPLITLDQNREITSRLKTGDIILTRQNWFSYNFIIPGFWGHSAIYIGSPKELLKWSSEDTTISNYYKTRGYKSFFDFLKVNYPKAFASYNDSTKVNRIIEALSAGVKFFPSEKSIGIVDVVAVLRPKLSSLEIAQVLEIAFSYYGTTYDTQLDFFDDDMLGCTELLYRSYLNKIDFEISYISGRYAVEPNSIARKYSQNSEGGQLDFVLFYDGNEKTHLAEEKDKNAFLNTPYRPKWRYDSDRIYPKKKKFKPTKEYKNIPISFSLLLYSELDRLFAKGSKTRNFFSLGVPNSAGDILLGVDFSILNSFYRIKGYGLQGSLFNSAVIGNFYGFQFSGLKGGVSKNLFGFSFSGYDNFVAKKSFGVQSSIIKTNSSLNNGIQLSLFNKTKINKMIQVGFFNLNQENLGFQFGIINKTKKPIGASFGLLNLMDNNKINLSLKNFYQISIDNYSKNRFFVSGLGFSKSKTDENFILGIGKYWGKTLFLFEQNFKFDNSLISTRFYKDRFFIAPSFSFKQNDKTLLIKRLGFIFGYVL